MQGLLRACAGDLGAHSYVVQNLKYQVPDGAISFAPLRLCGSASSA